MNRYLAIYQVMLALAAQPEVVVKNPQVVQRSKHNKSTWHTHHY